MNPILHKVIVFFLFASRLISLKTKQFFYFDFAFLFLNRGKLTGGRGFVFIFSPSRKPWLTFVHWFNNLLASRPFFWFSRANPYPLLLFNHCSGIIIKQTCKWQPSRFDLRLSKRQRVFLISWCKHTAVHRVCTVHRVPSLEVCTG